MGTMSRQVRRKPGKGQNRAKQDNPPSPTAKIVRPRLVDVFHRARLFSWLDDAARRANVLWIEGPPGAGKTTLVSSWLDTRKRPCLWYQIDAGDNDLATFFHYLGLAAKLAAPRHKTPLPHLTPEYLAGVETFARRYFEQLCQRLPAGTVIVFDNFQEVGIDSRLYDVLCASFEHLSQVHVLCISRTAPPDAFARLRAHGQLALLDAAAMQLSSEEAEGVATAHGATELDNVAQIHKKTRGWAAGLVLMLERHGAATDLPQGEDVTPQVMFAYFAGQILRHLEEPMRVCLMQSALLPKMHAADVEALTGYAKSGRMLAELQNKNYFTYRLAGREAVYEYHPLFREFLLTRLQETPAQLALKQQQAAQLLEARGDIEAATSLRAQAGDWSGIAHTIETHAAQLLEQGRGQQLAQWLDALPRETFDRSPRLLYWNGMSRLAIDPVTARASFEQGYERFRREGDAAGAYLAWIAIIDSFVFEWSNFTPMLPWVEEFEQLRRAHPEFPSRDIEQQVAIAIFAGLMYAQPCSPDLAAWAQRVGHMTSTVDDAQLCVKAMPHLSMYYSQCTGDQTKGGALIQRFGAMIAKPEVAPFARITWYAATGTFYLNAGEFEECIAKTNEGLKLADTHGIHLWDKVLCCGGSFAMIMMGNPAAAEPYLERMAAQFDPRRRIDSVCYYIPLAAWHIARAEFGKARAVLEQYLPAIENTGYYYGEIIVLMGLMRLCIRAGEHDTAEALLQRAGVAARLGNNRIAEHFVNVAEAELALACNDEARCLRALRAFLDRGKRGNIILHPFWDAELMAHLYAKALEHDIELDHVRAVIKKLRIAPPLDISPEKWPWPIRIYTLGRFTILKNDTPIVSSGKAQKKPLELLKAVIALGGRDVSVNTLIEILWPDLDADAKNLFGNTLHRLRKLLGNEEAILVSDGAITLNPQIVWVDVWAFERLTRLLPATQDGEVEQSLVANAAKAFALYQGHFLARETDQPSLLPLRERLRSKFLRHLTALGQHYVAMLAYDQAIELYQRGIELDSLAEELYRYLMHCQHQQGNHAEAINVYRRCREMLSLVLGIKPSAETEALHERVRQSVV